VPLGNQPPVLNQPADMTVTAGLTADQALTATDTCDAATLTFTKVSGPAFVTVTSAGNVHVAPGPTDVGTHGVAVAVSDGVRPACRTRNRSRSLCFRTTPCRCSSRSRT
jgi:hypothetical protein